MSIIYLIRKFKKDLMYGAYILFMLIDLLTLQGLIAELMHKYTDIDTSVWLNSISTMMVNHNIN
ncbi:hypothetical protein KPL47_02305 [Clostridium estertheticum]|uniref:hypothetical protein n=1 Tax=Clostridium estertheticum TaxID=238834 RepID=UPI001C0CAFC9|nr:hypothetical protein [Clostridium estertheticum]MBU3175195.1 hypothetical protein [Clostridium estertheticum]